MQKPTPQRPLVSICLPVYNGAPWIAEAVESALAQTYSNLEIVVSDNASTDASADIVRSFDDPRIRLDSAEHRVSMSANHNRAIRLARGPLLKFLHADDELLPTCVTEMVDVAVADERIGLVFAPREIRLGDPTDPEALAWAARFGALHEQFARLERVNDGRDLLCQIVDDGVTGNWIGEPTSVLVRKDALTEVGGFNVRIIQRMDLELWLRLLARYRVGFVDHTLSVYRHHSDSTTATNARTANDALDNVWLFHTLSSLRDTGLDAGRLRELRRKALVDALSVAARRLLHGRGPTELLAYVGHRTARRAAAVNWSLVDARKAEGAQ